MILYMYIASGQGLTTPWGQTSDVNRIIFSLRSFFASLKTISLNSDFIHFFFHDFIHVYSPGAGACRQPPEDKVLMSTEMSCHFIHLLQASKNVFEVGLYTIFFS